VIPTAEQPIDENSDDSEGEPEAVEPRVDAFFTKYANAAPPTGASTLVYQPSSGLELPGALYQPSVEEGSFDFAESQTSTQPLFGSVGVGGAN
jgi:hypothetical protein